MTSSGLVLTNNDVTIELIQEDLPAPVCPAISTWGNSAKLSNLGLPEISKPKPMFRGCSAFCASFEDNTSPKDTSFLCLLGISIPIALLPGIGANNLTSGVANAYAISCERDVTLDTLTPGANSISYLVTVGPGTTLVNSASTPCSFNKFVRSFAVSCKSFLEVDTAFPSFNNLTGGKTYLLFLTFGFGLVIDLVTFFSLKSVMFETLFIFSATFAFVSRLIFLSDASVSLISSMVSW